jgi:hypothetical protein
MQTEKLFGRVAIICAVLLLFAPTTGRTSWTYVGGSEMRAEGGGMTHSAGWDWIAPLAGTVAMASLIIGRWLRPRPVLGAVVAAISFSIATAAALGHWLDLRSGSLQYANWTIHPAPAVGLFAGITATGTIAVLALLGHWRRAAQPV